LRSALKESGKFSEGVVLSKSMEMLFRAVLTSINLTLTMTDPEEKNERYELMMKHRLGELDVALRIAEAIDHNRGIDPVRWWTFGGST
jgi:hypothetical protein